MMAPPNTISSRFASTSPDSVPPITVEAKTFSPTGSSTMNAAPR